MNSSFFPETLPCTTTSRAFAFSDRVVDYTMTNIQKISLLKIVDYGPSSKLLGSAKNLWLAAGR
jgi:hypothetical protein